MKSFLACLAVLIIASAALATPVSRTVVKTWKECNVTITTGVIQQIDVTPCATEPCKFPKGSTVTMKVTFKPKTASNTLKPVVTGIIAGVNTPFPLPNQDGCKSVGCPIAVGNTYTYEESLYIESIYPKVTLTMKLQMTGDNSAEIFCFTMPASIVD